MIVTYTPVGAHRTRFEVAGTVPEEPIEVTCLDCTWTAYAVSHLQARDFQTAHESDTRVTR